MRFTNSLRYKLCVLFLSCIVIPVLALSFITSSYYQQVMKKRTKILTLSALTAMSQNISTYLDDLERLTLAPYLNEDIMSAIKEKSTGTYTSSDEYTKLSTNRALFSTLPNFLQNTRSDIVGCVLYTFDNSLFVTWKNDYTRALTDYPVSESEWFKEALKADGRIAYIGLHLSDYFAPSNITNVFSLARLIKDPDSRKPIGVIMADADNSIFHKMVSDISFDVSSIVIVLDHRGSILYSNRQLTDDMKAQVISNKPTVKGDKDSYILVSKIIKPADWKIVVLSSYSEIASRTNSMYAIAVLFAIGGLCITFLLFLTLSYKFVTPFKKMISTMEKVKEGNLDVQCEIHGNDEIAQLGIALNNMISKLNDLIDREYRAILNQRNAEYQALQSQIQPHFLYNTLNGLIYLNRMGEQEGVENAILSLTGMLRYILEHEDLSPISEEFLFLERYCDLQKLRFEERLEVDIQYDEEISKYKIPKLLLQPIVENAIIHGIEPLDKPCLVKIHGRLENNNGYPLLKLTIQDNGIGFDINSPFMKPNIGLSNVEARLKMAFKGSVIEMDSNIGVGTSVAIKIPKEEITR